MPKTLLLADDSVTIQKVVGITFANEDVELVTVDNGDDALIRARQMKPDLVLADIGMPGLDGYALCGAIRKDPTIAHTPVLLLTGTFETYDEEKAREVGANGYISKPFEAQALVDRVFAMLAQSAAKPAAPPAPPAAAPRPMAAPAAPPAVTAAPPAPPAPQVRPRPELPNVPSMSPPKPPARPSAPAPTPRPVEPFEFDTTPPPSAAQPQMQPPAPAPVEEPLWEAEPALEMPDDSPVLRAALESELPDFDTAPTPAAPADSTRFFAPDLLGRPARLPDVPDVELEPEPPRDRHGGHVREQRLIEHELARAERALDDRRDNPPRVAPAPLRGMRDHARVGRADARAELGERHRARTVERREDLRSVGIDPAVRPRLGRHRGA